MLAADEQGQQRFMEQDNSFQRVAKKYGLNNLYAYRLGLLILALILAALWVYSGFAILLGLLCLSSLLALAAVFAITRGTPSDNGINTIKKDSHIQAQQGLMSKLSAEKLAESLPDPLVIFDRYGTILYFNSAAALAFPQIKLQAPIYLCFRTPEMHALFQSVMDDGQTRSVDYRERLPFDRCYHVSMMAAEVDGPQPIDGGAVLTDNTSSYTLILRDQSELQRLDRMRSDFVANASHELRTPLASLRGFIETLQGSARNDAAARERFLIIMQQQADRMARLIDDLLSLSRLEVKPAVAHRETVDIPELITHVTDTLAPLADELGVMIIWQRPQEGMAVTGDRDELIQVFQNLIENACKYGQSGKQVVITAIKRQVRVPAQPSDGSPMLDGSSQKNSSAELVVEIQDFGPGIPAKDLPRLTERFYRVNSADGKRYKGTGLGLAIVKHILNRHRARLLIRSQLGEGAVFTVIFPLDKAEQPDG